MKKNSKINFNVELNTKQTRIILIIIVILLVILLFRRSLVNIVEKFIVFTVIFLLILLISKNLIITFIASCIIFLFFNLIMNYKKTVENFQDLDKESKESNESQEINKSKENIQELLKKINGGIKLEESDLKETDTPLNIDLEKYSDDNKPNALKLAQKETYELINTVNALKDTLTTLSPVLKEGKKIMQMFNDISL
jgi:predicted membrane protein